MEAVCVRPVRAFRPEHVSKPRDWRPFTLPAGPLDIEVGCGVGYHPIRYARLNPERFLVAIEHTQNRFERFARRVSRHPELPNLLPVQADAIAWITHSLPAVSVDRYFFYYPNPYPKPGDRNKRWHAMPFMAKVIETLKPGGSLWLATNEEFYFEEALAYLGDFWRLRIGYHRAFRREDEPQPRTHFEKKYLDRGERCFEARFVKE